MVDPVVSAADVRARLSQHPDVLPRYGVASIAVFGSVARGDPTPDSDVDVLVSFSRPTGAFAVMRLERELATIFGRRVEIVTRAALKPHLRERIIAEAVNAA